MVLAWLDRNRPDVLCLQETKVCDEDFPALAFREQGYYAVYSGEKAYNGVALICRHPPRHVQTGLGGAGSLDHSRLLSADVGGVRVVNTYVPQGRDIGHPLFQYKLEWFGRLSAYFARNHRPSEPLVWVGDINVARGPLDVHNPEARARHVCYHEDARKAFERCLHWGFVDVFRAQHPEGGHYTFFDYRTPDAVKAGQGWRIDYILASKSMAPHCRNAWIDLEPRLQPGASDHTVLAADFDESQVVSAA